MIEFIKQKMIALYSFFVTPPKACWIDRSVFEYVNKFDGGKVINLGSGIGTFDEFIKVKTIDLDIRANPNIHIIADAHYLPFKDGSIDCIFSNAVLEHVQFPWIVSKEINRVLKKGGYVCINVPFLNIIHDSYGNDGQDYFRFTPKGLRACFQDFQEVKTGMSAGPMAFLVVYLGSLISTLVNIRVIGFLISLPFKLVLYPFFYLDLLMMNKKWETFADAFYFVGIKR